MRRYRCYHDIIEALLSNLLEGEVGITRLCSKANIPLNRCKKLLSILEEYGLVVKVVIGTGFGYRILERGYEWLSIYHYLKELLPIGIRS